MVQRGSLGRRNRRHRAAAGGRVRHLRRGDSSLRRAGVHQSQQLLALDDDDPEDSAVPPKSSTTPTIIPARWPSSRGRINPYKLGIELLRDIEHRWNTGKFGKEYDECDDLEKRRNWDKQLGLGRQKIFEVRRVHNDITFIDTFLTPEFCVQHNMFSFAWQEQAGGYMIESREFEKIKQRLLFSLTNFGKPWIYVVDGNFRNRGELLLAAPPHRRRTPPRSGGGHPGERAVHLGPAGQLANARRWQAHHAFLRRQRTQHQNRRRDR